MSQMQCCTLISVCATVVNESQTAPLTLNQYKNEPELELQLFLDFYAVRKRLLELVQAHVVRGFFQNVKYGAFGKAETDQYDHRFPWGDNLALGPKQGQFVTIRHKKSVCDDSSQNIK